MWYTLYISEVFILNICPHLEFSFRILGKKWNGLILHYLSLYPTGSAHFSEMRRDITDITSRALSLKLTELAQYGLIEKKVTIDSHVDISYELTDKGRALTLALQPIQQWAQLYSNERKEEMK